MNYDQPRQVDVKSDRPDAGKWRWTTRNDNNVRPDGYCSPWEMCPAGHGIEMILTEYECDTCGGKGLIEKADPCPGHDTAEEAAEHYRQYRIDRARFVEIIDADAQMLHRCRMCDKHTASYLTIEGDGFFHESVCPDHHDRHTAEFLIQLSMGSVHS